MEKEQYDIIFLDIMLPQMDGVELGSYIRNVKNDNYTQIVYISSETSYAMELFEVRPLNFLIKPLDEKKIQKVLELFLKLNGGMETIL